MNSSTRYAFQHMVGPRGVTHYSIKGIIRYKRGRAVSRQHYSIKGVSRAGIRRSALFHKRNNRAGHMLLYYYVYCHVYEGDTQYTYTHSHPQRMSERWLTIWEWCWKLYILPWTVTINVVFGHNRRQHGRSIRV